MSIRKCWPLVLLFVMTQAGCAADLGDSISNNGIATAPKEVIVRLCSDVSLQQAETIFARYSLWVSKRLSINLLTLEWSDERSVSDVLSDLDGVSGICMAQPNYGYDISPASPGSPK